MIKLRWRELWFARRVDVGIGLMIVLLCLFFWSPLLISRKFLIIGDALLYSYPLRTIAWDAIRHGSLPLWTPLLFSGYPLFSMAVIALEYPLTWGYLFLPGYWAEQIFIVAPFFFSPLFTYAYCREIGRSRPASLLAGLAFSYGGLFVSPLGHNGMVNNAVMWLPLMLIAVERARTCRMIPCLLAAIAVYLMSVFTGIGQAFLYVGIIAVLYAMFIGLLVEKSNGTWWKNRARWRPLAVAVGAILFSAGIAAFQILETMRAARRSVRGLLSYEIFGEGSFTFSAAWGSLIAPIYHHIDVTAYVVPLAVGLAVVAVVRNLRNPQRDLRVFFWLVLALVAWVLMLGINTPIYRLVYHTPLINRFRVPSRHSFEWVFAIAVMGAYGWDVMSTALSQAKETNGTRKFQRLAVGVILLSGIMVVGLFWKKAASQSPLIGSTIYTGLPEASYLLWKVGFVLLTLLTVWQGWRMAESRGRTVLLTVAISLTCFIEPFTMASLWWFPQAQSADRFSTISPASRFLQNFSPQEHRVYTRVNPFAEQIFAHPKIDAQNLSVLPGLHNVAGYEPLIMERYSRALGNVGLDAVNPRAGFTSDRSLFEPQSHVLDLLNTTFVMAYSNMGTEPLVLVNLMEKDGVRLMTSDLAGEVGDEPPLTLTGTGPETDTLTMVTTMADSAGVEQGAPVARLRLYSDQGSVIERELRAGVDTSEWAHERNDVRQSIRHALAPVFDSKPGDQDNSFPSNRYWSRLPLGQRLRVGRVEVSKLLPNIHLLLWKASLYDSVSKVSVPLSPAWPDKWEQVYDSDGVEIVRNKTALPRAWLVAEAESAGPEEALQRITGKSQRPLDPKRTVLLEVWPKDLPALPGGPISSDATTHITVYQPGHLVIETKADNSSVLIVSELNYRGWEAWVDSVKTPILTADYLLRGVTLAAGSHRVEMRYSDPAVKQGIFISIATLLLIGGLAIYTRRRSEDEPMRSALTAR